MRDQRLESNIFQSLHSHGKSGKDREKEKEGGRKREMLYEKFAFYDSNW